MRRFWSRICWLILLLGTGFAGNAHAERIIRVALDSGADYTTIQAAVDSVPADNTEPTTIRIAAGAYHERVTVPRNKPYITFHGESAERTTIHAAVHAGTLGDDGKPVGTSGSATVYIHADDFAARDISFENRAGDVGQAVAMKITGDRAHFFRCRFIGWQDTLYANSPGRNYFLQCHIEGRVDFIFGQSTAVFDRCTIHSKNGGCVTAPSTPADKPFGFVFLNCELTGEGKGQALLGRPWRPHGAAAFIGCTMGGHIAPRGWDDWGDPANRQTARFIEADNLGPGADTAHREPWSRNLPTTEIDNLSARRILSGEDNWDPTR